MKFLHTQHNSADCTEWTLTEGLQFDSYIQEAYFNSTVPLLLPIEKEHSAMSRSKPRELLLSGYPWLIPLYVWTRVITESFANSVDAGGHDYLSKLPCRFKMACVTLRE